MTHSARRGVTKALGLLSKLGAFPWALNPALLGTSDEPSTWEEDRLAAIRAEAEMWCWVTWDVGGGFGSPCTRDLWLWQACNPTSC